MSAGASMGYERAPSWGALAAADAARSIAARQIDRVVFEPEFDGFGGEIGEGDDLRAPPFIEIDGKRYLWRDLVKLRSAPR